MNTVSEMPPKTKVGVDERWRGAAVLAAIAAVVLPLLLLLLKLRYHKIRSRIGFGP